MFPFNLAESERFSRSVLAEHSGQSLDSWGDVCSGYRSAKRSLIDALCPQTGRREYDYSREVTDAQRARGYRESLLGGALRQCADYLETARIALASAPDQYRESAAASLVRREKTLSLIQSASESLSVFSGNVSDYELADGKIGSGGTAETVL